LRGRGERQVDATGCVRGKRCFSFFSSMSGVGFAHRYVLALISLVSRHAFSSCHFLRQGGPGSPMESAFNGAGTMSMGKHTEFIPGSVIACDDSGFVKAYVGMCDRAGVSFAEAVEMRHKLLLSRQGTAQAHDEDEEELAMIGEPDGDPESAERKAWYEAWAKQRQEGGGGGDGLGDNPMAALMSGAGGGAAPDQMMQMLMGMMQGGVGMQGMGGMAASLQPDNGRRVRVADLELLQRYEGGRVGEKETARLRDCAMIVVCLRVTLTISSVLASSHTHSSVTAHPALEWDARMADLASQEGIVKTDDPSDGTTHVTFPPPVGVVAWLPTDALTDIDGGGGGGGGGSSSSKFEVIE
jgi:hypothetical protein